MEFKGEKNKRIYTISVEAGKVQSILVEEPGKFDRAFHQRGLVKHGFTITEQIFEEAVMAICQKDLVSWMGLFDAIWDDKTYGQSLLQNIFKNILIKIPKPKTISHILTGCFF